MDVPALICIFWPPCKIIIPVSDSIAGPELIVSEPLSALDFDVVNLVIPGAEIKTLPALVPSPAVIKVEAPTLVAESPALMRMSPDPEVAAFPVKIDTPPPFVPEFPVLIEREPFSAPPLAPLTTFTSPEAPPPDVRIRTCPPDTPVPAAMLNPISPPWAKIDPPRDV